MIGLIAVGVLGGLIAGLLGVGGGVVFVPALVLFAGLDQHAAEATSLLAIIPVAIVGAWRQDRYGNVRRRDRGPDVTVRRRGAFAGVQIADALSGRVLRSAFAVLLFFTAVQLVRTSLARSRASTVLGCPDDLSSKLWVLTTRFTSRFWL